MNTQTRNPRFNRSFSITLLFENYSLNGTAVNPSSFGASVEVSETVYQYLEVNTSLWEKNVRIKAKTPINDVPASVNSLYKRDEKFFLSVKLLDDRSWYN